MLGPPVGRVVNGLVVALAVQAAWAQGIGHIAAKQHDDVVAVDLCLGKTEFARGVERDSVTAATCRKVVWSLGFTVLRRGVRASLALSAVVTRPTIHAAGLKLR
ncbi:hypothetical protein [Acidisphaera sp. L21]|uniref:hypothetical protein n=1 Tax=Acidisphaera sp. L21 TaxID=1641851 RepID=UPI00131C01D4|nr:hypothetical protein [Acidisphaera sp. L21]